MRELVTGRRAPIVHELTHMLLGYTRANGHWTEEGIASYMQDKYGEDNTFPTRKMPYAIMKVILEEQAMLPMTRVFEDRDRRGVFNYGDRWTRWLAYTQSSSFCTYLIETYGLKKFMMVYDQPYESQDFERAFGKTADKLVDDWLAAIRRLDRDLTVSRTMYRRFNDFAHRR